MIEALYRLDVLELVTHFGLVLLRAGGLVVFLPIFGSAVIAPRFRVTLATVLAFVLLPFAPRLAVPPADVVQWTIVAIRELAAGFGIGLAARMVFTGVEAAAQLVAGQSGFSLASMVDPATGDQAAAPNIFMKMLTVSLFLAADLHHLFIRGIESSYRLLPPSISMPVFTSLDRVVSALGIRLFTIAVELAAPALIVTIAVDLVIVLVGKAMPQIPILIVGYPFKMAVGLVAIGLLAVVTGSTIGWIGRTVASDGAAVINAFAGN